MKIARTSRLNVLTPVLLLALLLISAGLSIIERASGSFSGFVPSARAQEKPRTPFHQSILTGTEKAVVATNAKAKAGAKALSGVFTEYALPKDARPQLMAVAPDGSIFYALGGSNKIGQILAPSSPDSDLPIREFPLPTDKSFAEGIVVAPDGIVWFTEQNAHQIGRLDPRANVITEYATPTPNSGPVGITVGADGNIWFTEAYANKIGMFDPDKPERMIEFKIPTPVSAALTIVSGPDDALWYVGVRGHKLGRVDPRSYAIVEYDLPTPKSGPTSLVVGSDGAIWVSEFNADKIARFDLKTKKFTDEIPVDSHKNGPRAAPGILVNGPDGNIWFTETFGNQISVLNLETREISEFTAPSGPQPDGATISAADTAKQALVEANVNLPPGESLGATSGPGGIAFSEDGTLWYTAMFSNKIARLRTK